MPSLIGLSSICWREAWKYGLRAWRYCQHDCGHAIAAVSYAAAALGWQTHLIFSAGDEEITALLGLDRPCDFAVETDAASAEAEVADVLLWVGDSDAKPNLEHLLPALLENLAQMAWHGHAHRLSTAHVLWPNIDSIHRTTHKSRTTESREPTPLYPPDPPTGNPAMNLSLPRLRVSVAALLISTVLRICLLHLFLTC